MFLCAMGIGAALSRKVFHDLLSTFLVIEIWLGVFGILTCPFLLYIGFVLDFTAIYFLAMLIFTGGIGIFVGLEIPLLSRYLETFTGSRRALANVLAADYIGSLVGSVAFPLVLLPLLGLIGSAAMALHGAAEQLLIMGGGDGLTAREIFKYPHVRSMTLVDLDSRILELAKDHPEFRKINADALRRSNIRIIAADAFAWIRHTDQRVDVVVADFPDPHAPALARLYSHEFYVAVKQRLKPGGVFVTQSSSPYFARKAFWAVRKTLESARFETASFHTDVPAFGDWGFHLAAEKEIDPNGLRVEIPTRYLTDELLVSMFVFGKDVSMVPTAVNTLNNMKLYSYYQMGDWEDY